MPTAGALDDEPDVVGLGLVVVVEEPVVEAPEPPMLLPEELELGEDMVPLEEPEPELIPELVPEPEEPMPVPEVPHAESTSAHARGMVHFIIKILLENYR